MNKTTLTTHQLGQLSATVGFEDDHEIIFLYRDSVFIQMITKQEALEAIAELERESYQEDHSFETFLKEENSQILREYQTWILCKNPASLKGKTCTPLTDGFGKENLLRVKKIILHDQNDATSQGEKFTLCLESTVKKNLQYLIRGSQVHYQVSFE